MRFIVTGDPAEVTLQRIEAMRLPTENRWRECFRRVPTVEKLVAEQLSGSNRRRRSVLDRLKDLLQGNAPATDKQAVALARREYNGHVANARALCILVVLKRYQNTAGDWPEGLDDVRVSVPNEILTDPFNGGSFVYRRTGDGFELYSAGENKTDESRTLECKGGDDRPIWPRGKEKASHGEVQQLQESPVDSGGAKAR